MLRAKLVVVGGDAKETEVDLRLPLVIGRGRDAGLTVPHALVSRRHSEIIERNGRLVVRDLGSLNGTFVNNQRIQDEAVLEPDQLLTLGNITFRAVYQIGDEAENQELASARETEAEAGSSTEPERAAAATEKQIDRADLEPDLIQQVETIPIDEFAAPPDMETLPAEGVGGGSSENATGANAEIVSLGDSGVLSDSSTTSSAEQVQTFKSNQEVVFEAIAPATARVEAGINPRPAAEMQRDQTGDSSRGPLPPGQPR